MLAVLFMHGALILLLKKFGILPLLKFFNGPPRDNLRTTKKMLNEHFDYLPIKASCTKYSYQRETSFFFPSGYANVPNGVPNIKEALVLVLT